MINWEELKVEWETTDISLVDLATKHDVKLGTLKSRKSREKWLKGATATDATSNQKDATILKVDATTERDISWINIETEYVTDMRKKPCTLKELAEKYGVSISRIGEYASQNEWTSKRDKHRKNTVKKTTEKIAELISDDAASVTARHFDVSNKLLEVLEQSVNTPGEFNRVVEKLRVGEFGEEEVQVVEINALAEKRLATVVTSLASIQKMQRETLDIVNAKEELARQQMQLNKDKTKAEIERLQKMNETGNQETTEEKLADYFTHLREAFTNADSE